MKAHDLRIGNWVEIEATGTQNQLTQVLEKGVNCGSIGVLYDMIKPIPITEEWLKRFGFKKTHSEMSYSEWDFKKIGVEFNSDIITVSYNYGNGVEWINFTHIQYIHQLQNLYHALTGEELQLKDVEP